MAELSAIAKRNVAKAGYSSNRTTSKGKAKTKSKKKTKYVQEQTYATSGTTQETTPVSNTSSLTASPEAATVLADIGHPDALKVNVRADKYKTELSEEQYKKYKQYKASGKTEQFYIETRRPMPVEQIIRYKIPIKKQSSEMPSVFNQKPPTPDQLKSVIKEPTQENFQGFSFLSQKEKENLGLTYKSLGEQSVKEGWSHDEFESKLKEKSFKEQLVINPKDSTITTMFNAGGVFVNNFRNNLYMTSERAARGVGTTVETVKEHPVKSSIIVGSLAILGPLASKAVQATAARFGGAAIVTPAVADVAVGTWTVSAFAGVKEAKEPGSVLSVGGATTTSAEFGTWGLLTAGAIGAYRGAKTGGKKVIDMSKQQDSVKIETKTESLEADGVKVQRETTSAEFKGKDKLNIIKEKTFELFKDKRGEVRRTQPKPEKIILKDVMGSKTGKGKGKEITLERKGSEITKKSFEEVFPKPKPKTLLTIPKGKGRGKGKGKDKNLPAVSDITSLTTPKQELVVIKPTEIFKPEKSGEILPKPEDTQIDLFKDEGTKVIEERVRPRDPDPDPTKPKPYEGGGGGLPLPPFLDFNLGGGLLGSYKRKTKPRGKKSKYTPSLTALSFNIVGTKPKGTLSGLEQRPILRKSSKKKKKESLTPSLLKPSLLFRL